MATPAPGASPSLPQPLLDGCRVLESRSEILNRLDKGSVGIEVGTFRGDFAAEMLRRVEPRELHLVDVTFANLRADVRDDPRVHLHGGLSVEVLAGFPDGHFDWAYIDGDHSYAAVRADIEAAWSKVRPGGLLIFNDFARYNHPGFGAFGVHKAVCEFVRDRRWPVVFWAFNGEALYDIALRRPDAPPA
jgi:SAM-dependent methyltransferase